MILLKSFRVLLNRRKNLIFSFIAHYRTFAGRNFREVNKSRNFAKIRFTNCNFGRNFARIPQNYYIFGNVHHEKGQNRETMVVSYGFAGSKMKIDRVPGGQFLLGKVMEFL